MPCWRSLPKPDSWAGAYPYDDGGHVWLYVRRRSMLPDGRFIFVEGWMRPVSMVRLI